MASHMHLHQLNTVAVSQLQTTMVCGELAPVFPDIIFFFFRRSQKYGCLHEVFQILNASNNLKLNK